MEAQSGRAGVRRLQREILVAHSHASPPKQSSPLHLLSCHPLFQLGNQDENRAPISVSRPMNR